MKKINTGEEYEGSDSTLFRFSRITCDSEIARPLGWWKAFRVRLSTPKRILNRFIELITWKNAFDLKTSIYLFMDGKCATIEK